MKQCENNNTSQALLDGMMLDRAARAALRGAGLVEPNPMVGCVIGHDDGTISATAHHDRFGGPHAEAHALALCTARGIDPQGATVWVTLEPCNHVGKTPACSSALIHAGVARVVYAERDPNSVAEGGAFALKQAGIEVYESDSSRLACALNAPFVKCIDSKRPWVIVKWAQTRDGFVSFCNAEPRWVTGASSRRDVHRLRARVDAIVTGSGTVKADDPMLTARDVRLRRRARRVVIDSRLSISVESALVQSAGQVPVLIYTADNTLQKSSHTKQLQCASVEIVGLPERDGHVDLDTVLLHLYRVHGASNVLIEAGPGLISAFLRANLVDEAWVYESPIEAGDRGDVRMDQQLLVHAGLVAVHERTFAHDVRRIYRSRIGMSRKKGNAPCNR